MVCWMCDNFYKTKGEHSCNKCLNKSHFLLWGNPTKNHRCKNIYTCCYDKNNI